MEIFVWDSNNKNLKSKFITFAGISGRQPLFLTTAPLYCAATGLSPIYANYLSLSQDGALHLLQFSTLHHLERADQEYSLSHFLIWMIGSWHVWDVAWRHSMLVAVCHLLPSCLQTDCICRDLKCYDWMTAHPFWVVPSSFEKCDLYLPTEFASRIIATKSMNDW